MKLKIGDKVYLQKYEVAHIMHEVSRFPTSILRETFSSGKSSFFIMNGPADRFRFECVYQQPENVRWFMEQDWIVDYDEYSKMSVIELMATEERLREKHYASVIEFNNKDAAYKETFATEEAEKFGKLEHKITSIHDLREFREGKVDFVFPEEYHTSTKKRNLFARLFSHSSAQ